ncbi:MAG: hypothetical protein EBZ89_12990, partial [Chloroflexi bacterium]|nr:hypothetical protein [Chloroflexota bacterium]
MANSVDRSCTVRYCPRGDHILAPWGTDVEQDRKKLTLGMSRRRVGALLIGGISLPVLAACGGDAPASPAKPEAPKAEAPKAEPTK